MNWEHEHVELEWTSFDRWILQSGGLRLIVVHYVSGEEPYCEWYVTIEGCKVSKGYYTSPDDAKATAVVVAKRLLTEMLSGLDDYVFSDYVVLHKDDLLEIEATNAITTKPNTALRALFKTQRK